MKVRKLQVALTRSFEFTAFLPILFYSLTSSATSIRTDANQCACPGNKLIYRCSVQGDTTGATIWNGTAFSGCHQNNILLPHHQFTPTGGPTGTCNNGAIVGQSLGVLGNNYTSQLNLTITPDTVGKTITCAYNALTTTQESIIRFSTIVPGQLQPPEKLHLSAANFTLGYFIFTWSPVAPDCSAIHYNILASNCGSCPTTTNHTNVTCTGIPTDGSVCAFGVQTVACENLAGNFSGMVNVTTYISSSTNDKGTVISSTLLVFLLIVYVTVSILIYIILVKGKLVVKHQLEQANELLKVNSKSCRVPQQRDEAIDTTDNTAYSLHAYN